MHDHTHTNDIRKDIADALAECAPDEGNYELDGDGLLTLRYVESDTSEVLAHADEEGVVEDCGIVAANLHHEAISALRLAVRRPQGDDLAHELYDRGYWVDKDDSGRTTYKARDGDGDTYRVATWAEGQPETCSVYDTTPSEVREQMWRYGYTVEPYRTRLRLDVALDSDRLEVGTGQSDRVIVRREMDGVLVADVAADDGEMFIRPEAMDTEAGELRRAAHALDLSVNRRQPVAAQ